MSQQAYVNGLINEIAGHLDYDISDEGARDKLYWDVMKACKMRYIKLDSPNYIVREGSAKHICFKLIELIGEDGYLQIATEVDIEHSRFESWLGSYNRRLPRKDLDNLIEYISRPIGELIDFEEEN
ncbi:hypothetical protein ACQGR7_17495 [Bacillus sp. Gnz1/3]|uniref:hypothetical protein n=1 Tax=Bacillus sp. Gnz1/3 TaxID=3418491 RepID=UPI003CED5A72